MRSRQFYLGIECAVVYFVVPPVLYFFRFFLAFKIVPLVLVFAAACVVYLLKSQRFERARLWRLSNFQGQAVEIVLLFVPLAGVLTMLAWHFLPLQYLNFTRTIPQSWSLALVYYPFLMAYPQEVVFRAFFFHRYNSLFANEKSMILVNALSFGIFHSLYGNWLAPLLSFGGGILFGWRYLRSRSVLLAGLEHGLWGDFIFTTGIGWYFYSGAIH